MNKISGTILSNILRVILRKIRILQNEIPIIQDFLTFFLNTEFKRPSKKFKLSRIWELNRLELSKFGCIILKLKLFLLNSSLIR